MGLRLSYLTIFVVSFVLVRPISGAAGWDWVANADGDAVVRCVGADAAGNVYVAGTFAGEISLDSLTLTSVYGMGDVFLLKLAPDGEVIWGRSAGGERGETGWGVTCDPAGRVYVTGDFASNTITFDTITLENNFQTPYIDYSSFDVFTACYDEDGNVLWARKAGGIWHDRPSEIKHDGDSSVYVLGTFYGSDMVFDTVSVANSGNVDLFLAKYDEAGHIQWAKSALGSGQENAWGLAVDSDDMIYIAGSYRSPTLTFGGHVLTNTSDDFDLYLAKYEPAGGPLWVGSAYGQDWDDATALTIDRWDNVYLAGHFESDTLGLGTTELLLSGGGSVNIDMFLAKLDGDGQVIWATSSTGPGWIYPYAACMWNTDRVAITGSFVAPGAVDTEYFGSWTINSNGSYDIFLVDCDLDGNPLSAENYGGTDMEFGQDVCQDDIGNLFLAAFFSSDSLVIGQTTLYNDYDNTMLVAKRPNPDIIAVPNEEPGKESPGRGIVVFTTPNPFNARTNVIYHLQEKGHVRLDVFDLRGRLVRTLVDRFQSVGRHAVAWDGRDLGESEVASGVYLYRLKTETGEVSGKVTLIK
jgi:hypothetical protein